MIFQLEDRVFLARRRHSHLLRALFRWASRDRLYNRRKHDPPRLHSRPGNQLFMQDSLLRILDGRFFFHERDSIGFESLESCVKNQNRERSESNNVEKETWPKERYVRPDDRFLLTFANLRFPLEIHLLPKNIPKVTLYGVLWNVEEKWPILRKFYTKNKMDIQNVWFDIFD